MGIDLRIRAIRQALPLMALIGIGLGFTVPAQSPTPPEKPQMERYLDWSRLPFPREEFERRRDLLMAELGRLAGGIFLTPSRNARSGGETFRQLNDFLYFTGLELPDSILVLDSHSSTGVVYAPKMDPRFESPSRPNDFPGRPLLEDKILQESSGLEFRDMNRFDADLASWVMAGRPLWVNLGRPGPLEPPRSSYVLSWSPEDAFLFQLALKQPSAQVRNAFAQVARLRMVKSGREIEALRGSIAITVAGIAEAARFITPGVSERSLEGELEAAFKRRGAQRLAFGSIIKSGPNSLWPWRILASHYDRRNRRMQSGELVIFDVGCELDYYASDIGRTFPVSGRFDDDQRRLVEMVREVSDAVLKEIRPRRTFSDLRKAALARIPAGERPYMQTGLFFGHHIGLDAGDPSLDDEPLRPGMVFTVEPWYYNHDRGIAVFIEDNVLVTASGVENLSAALPRSAGGLETLMAPPAMTTPPPESRSASPSSAN